MDDRAEPEPLHDPYPGPSTRELVRDALQALDAGDAVRGRNRANTAARQSAWDRAFELAAEARATEAAIVK